MKFIQRFGFPGVLQILFVFCCISSTVCFAVSGFTDVGFLFTVGNVLIFGWILNPTGAIMLVLGIGKMLKKDGADNQSNSRNQGSWYLLFAVVDLLLYIAAAILTVVFTGGV